MKKSHGLRLFFVFFKGLRNKVVKTLLQAKAQKREFKGNIKKVWQTINQLTMKDSKSCNKCLE